MPQPKLTPEQARRIEELDEYRRATDYLKHLVVELEANRAGQTRTIQQLSEKIVIAASQMRQRALTANIGSVADIAGTMSVTAGRGGGINMKIRALGDAVNSLYMQLEATRAHVMKPPEPKQKPT
jgi:hypothetical protein